MVRSLKLQIKTCIRCIKVFLTIYLSTYIYMIIELIIYSQPSEFPKCYKYKSSVLLIISSIIVILDFLQAILSCMYQKNNNSYDIEGIQGYRYTALFIYLLFFIMLACVYSDENCEANMQTSMIFLFLMEISLFIEIMCSYRYFRLMRSDIKKIDLLVSNEEGHEILVTKILKHSRNYHQTNLLILRESHGLLKYSTR